MGPNDEEIILSLTNRANHVMQYISQQQARHLLANIASDGVFFGAFARRRSDGTVKHWNAKSIEDTMDTAHDLTNDLATVYDAKAEHPKSLALDGITEIRCYGQTFKVIDNDLPF
jgi:hypothetical protein